MEKFFQVPNEIFEANILSIYHKMVLIYLFRAGNHGSPIFPSYSTIAKKCGMSRAKAIKVISQLESLCIIKVKQRRIKGSLNTTNLYSIDRETLIDYIVHDVDHGKPQDINTGEYNISDTSGGSLDTPLLVDGVDPINNQYYKEPIKKTHSLDSASKTLSFSEYKIQFGENKDPEDIKAIEFFIDYKKSIHGEHKKMKPAKWDRAVEEIRDFYVEIDGLPERMGKSGLNNYKALVERYFVNLGEFKKSCDYSIPHFNSPYIKAFLYNQIVD